MVTAPFSLRQDYWESFNIEDQDLNFLYNLLLELETPLTPVELTRALVTERIRQEKDALQNQQSASGAIFLPKDHYQTGQSLLFPALEWEKGQVVSIRPGHNPEYPSFDVLEVAMEKGGIRHFAAGVSQHKLNQPIEINLEDPLLKLDYVMNKYGEQLAGQLEDFLKSNPDLERIAGRWFPRALLVDVTIGHLNLVEAVLDMAGGGPLPTRALLEQIELPTDVNAKLTEFSLNFAIQEDSRFDEVGPSGEVLWFLRRLEPEPVRELPVYLRWNPVNYDRSLLSDAMLVLEKQLDDELAEQQEEVARTNEVVFHLTFPHWRSGTIPLTKRIRRMFPTALESPRVQFNLVDGENGQKISGWVVRPLKYVYGLREWYTAQGLIPGSLVHIRKGNTPGEVTIQAEKRRTNREWIRTMLVGTDGGIVFAMLKQVVTAAFDERMAIAIPDVEALNQVWENGSWSRTPFDKVAVIMMRELAKLNPQGHVHAQELYAALNLVRRCPPGPLFSSLVSNRAFSHVGDLYYRLSDAEKEF